MSRPVSRTRIIRAIIRKDLAEYGRDRLWAFLTVMVLVATVALYWVLPDDVSESIRLGASGLDPAVLVGLDASQEGLDIIEFASAADLEAVVAGDADAWTVEGTTRVISGDAEPPTDAARVNVSIGLAFPAGFIDAVAAGRATEVAVFLDGAVPDELEVAMTSLVREIAFAAAGDPPPIDILSPTASFEVLGEVFSVVHAYLRGAKKYIT